MLCKIIYLNKTPLECIIIINPMSLNHPLGVVVLVLLTPVVETGLELLISRVAVAISALPLGREGSASSSLSHVVKVSNDVEAESASVADGVGNTRADLQVRETIVGIRRGASRQPDFRRSVAVAEEDGGKTGDGVVGVGDAELGTLGRAHVVGENIVADSGRTKAVQIARVTVAAEVGSSNDGNSTTKRVAGDDEAVALVLVEASADQVVDRAGDLIPSIGETGVHLAARGEVAVLPLENNIGNEVSDVVAATDGQNNLAAGVVDSNVGGDASAATRSATNSVDGVALNISAGSVAADGITTVYAGVAVRGSGVLDVELEAAEVGRADTIFNMLATWFHG